MLKLPQLSPDQASAAGQPQKEQSQIYENPFEAHRRSERIQKEVAILLVGNDAQGKSFMEETRTVVLSRHGASIISGHKLAAEQELLLAVPDQNREIPIRVVGQTAAEGSSYTYGIAFVESHTDFWGIDFAETPESGASGQLLECRLCGQREKAHFGDLESGVCTSGTGLLKYCKRCASSTRWKLCLADASESPVVEVQVATELAASSPASNRRRHVRAKANFGVLIRVHGQEDLACCENVSRGGLCFLTNHRYFENTRIELAAPYSSGSACILVPGRIVHVQEMREGNRFRCGVEYLPKTSEKFVGAAA